MSRKFIVRRYVVKNDLDFNRLHIHQEPFGSVSTNMQEYVDNIVPIEVSKERRRQHQDKCATSELTAYQALTGNINFLGQGVLSQAAFAASCLQEAVGSLKVANITHGDNLLAEIKALSPILLFRTPSSILNPSYCSINTPQRWEMYA